MNAIPEVDALEQVRRYYGEVLNSSDDLKTGACCATETMPDHLRPLLANVHIEVRTRFYGCGAPLPPALEGRVVLDLGCGSGRDCYLLSQLVGEDGRVIGVDMTGEQLAVARRHVGWHTNLFGYRRPNIRFIEGFIEELGAAGLEDNSVDVVVSNCVINLSPHKERVFAEMLRVLKPGGEFYFSGVFADRRPLLDAGIERKIGHVQFRSLTVRGFKLPLEDRCEDYGQLATYLGTIDGHPHAFVLDDHHRFERGRPMPVCGNTADMLSGTRYASHFRIAGDKATHFGLFSCAPAAGAITSMEGVASCC